MKTAVIYARYSSERQTDQSIEGQMRVCKDFAERNGLNIVDTYVDKAMTGTNDNRIAFQRMLSDSEKAKWEVVLVYAIDRFGRNSIEIALNKQRLQRNGKILISATQRTSVNVDGTQNLDGIILENVMIGIAEYYSAELSQKVKRGMNENRIKGKFCGGTVSYGYKVVNQHVQIDENEAYIVKRIYHEYLDGKYARMIAEELNSEGITRRGKPFCQSEILRILSNKNYVGEYSYKGTVFPNMYPAIISKDVFEKMQYILKDRKIGSYSRDTEFLLKGKITCGVCGKKMNGESGTQRDGSRSYYYKCSNKKHNTKNCTKLTVRKDALEQEITNVTMQLLKDEQGLDYIADKIIELNEQESQNKSELLYWISERDNAQNSLNNILKAIEQGICIETTKSRAIELENLIKEYDVKIQAEKTKEESKLTKQEVLTYLQSGTADTKYMLQALIDKIVLYDDKIEIYYNYKPTRPDEPEHDLRDVTSDNVSPVSACVPPAQRTTQVVATKKNHQIRVVLSSCFCHKKCTPKVGHESEKL